MWNTNRRFYLEPEHSKDFKNSPIYLNKTDKEKFVQQKKTIDDVKNIFPLFTFRWLRNYFWFPGKVHLGSQYDEELIMIVLAIK